MMGTLLRRAVRMAASFKSASRSAPVKPGVLRAIFVKSTSGASALLRLWTCRHQEAALPLSLLQAVQFSPKPPSPQRVCCNGLGCAGRIGV
jgi:hypothetical protein